MNRFSIVVHGWEALSIAAVRTGTNGIVHSRNLRMYRINCDKVVKISIDVYLAHSFIIQSIVIEKLATHKVYMRGT